MGSYQSLLKRCGAPAVPLPAPEAADFEQVAGAEEGKDAVAAWETKMLPPGAATELPWPRNTPRSEVACVWSAADCAGLAPAVRGGETEALARLSTCMKRSTWVATYEKPKTAPTALDPSTTALSPHMSLGCLSPRTMWYAVEASAAEAPSSVTRSKPPVSLHGQLMWRDFNTLIAYSANAHSPGSWGRMEGNKYCRSIPWDTDPALLTAWKEGRTGFPWIDACMAQLRQEGWIHHLGRHAVACFLTRGDLWQHWEEGAAHFEAHLLDADYALNTFNWLWLSCSGFFYQYFRCYSPVAMQKKNDPTGRYIRKYVPQLRSMPDKYIYEPWLAPAGVQKSAGCVVGVDYPAPVVDHKVISKANMGRMAAAYEAHKAKHGTGTAAKKKKASTSQSKKTKKTTDETEPKKTKRLKQTKLAP
uniref:Cryptochrome/DNA photolyase FAD-binding domain-containing protein n=1 Tax=Octactis speculum TaxID=3111310 RepID=A0A7S2C4N2_9STRA